MNSIRESCRSIEELDLGGNKLNDLIEVYKILQCTPNLKFLNLSENDLSRTSPVVMASAATSPSSTYSSLSSNVATPTSTTLLGSFGAYSSTTSPANQQGAPPWPNNSVSVNQRTCLGTINQNSPHQTAIGARRHSSLGQSTVPVNVPNAPTTPTVRAGSSVGPRARQIHPPSTRATEVRRLAAAAAVAQSKKTSSSVASKLTSSATGGTSTNIRASQRRDTTAGPSIVDLPSSNSSENRLTRGSLVGSSQRLHQSPTTSTMHLARSLSSLSAQDLRISGSSLSSRLAAHRSSARKDTVKSQQGRNATVRISQQTRDASGASSSLTSKQLMIGDHKPCTKADSARVSETKGKLFAEPIVESDDIDMSEAVQQANLTHSSSCVGSNSSNQQHQGTKSLTNFSTGSSNSGFELGPARAAPSSLSTNQQASPVSNQSANFRRTFESIKALALNNTGCQWKVVCSILNRMPNLEELHLSLNNYERIDLEPTDFKHLALKRLYLCNNPKLTNWEELDKLLVAFPSLEALSIAECNISQIPDNLDRAREWRKLCGLNINGWPIKEWPVIERLNQLPSLIDLKCRNLEILNTIDEPRHHLIARLPKLQRLNGSEIEEREHAEKAFLRFFMANAHLERPSRFHELIQIHGEVAPVDIDVDLSPPSHAQIRVIYLNRTYFKDENEDDILMSEDFLTKLMDNVEPSTDSMDLVDAEGNSCSNEDEGEGENKLIRLFKDEKQEVLALTIDLRQSVRKFKSTLASLFHMSSRDLILYYIDHEMVGLMGPELIKHNQKKLWNYNVQDGDQFIVEQR